VNARVELQGGAAAAGEKARPPDTPGLPQVEFAVLGLLCLFNSIFHCCDTWCTSLFLSVQYNSVSSNQYSSDLMT
jgi:hypothetical protein